MHHVSGLFYVGQPNETVTLTTQVDNGGQINVSLDGQPIAGNTQFRLPSSPGSQSMLQIGLFGPTGASCAVGLADVDGGTDGDFLLCQVHNPAPVHFFTFAVAAVVGVTAFANIKAAAPAKRSKPVKKGAKAVRKGSGK